MGKPFNPHNFEGKNRRVIEYLPSPASYLQEHQHNQQLHHIRQRQQQQQSAFTYAVALAEDGSNTNNYDDGDYDQVYYNRLANINNRNQYSFYYLDEEAEEDHLQQPQPQQQRYRFLSVRHQQQRGYNADNNSEEDDDEEQEERRSINDDNSSDDGDDGYMEEAEAWTTEYRDVELSRWGDVEILVKNTQQSTGSGNAYGGALGNTSPSTETGWDMFGFKDVQVDQSTFMMHLKCTPELMNELAALGNNYKLYATVRLLNYETKMEMLRASYGRFGSTSNNNISEEETRLLTGRTEAQVCAGRASFRFSFMRFMNILRHNSFLNGGEAISEPLQLEVSLLIDRRANANGATTTATTHATDGSSMSLNSPRNQQQQLQEQQQQMVNQHIAAEPILIKTSNAFYVRSCVTGSTSSSTTILSTSATTGRRSLFMA